MKQSFEQGKMICEFEATLNMHKTNRTEKLNASQNTITKTL